MEDFAEPRNILAHIDAIGPEMDFFTSRYTATQLKSCNLLQSVNNKTLNFTVTASEKYISGLTSMSRYFDGTLQVQDNKLLPTKPII